MLAADGPSMAQVDGNKSELELYKSFLEQTRRPSIEAQLGQASTKLNEAEHAKDPVAKARALKELGLIHLT
jgi:hypothetical protein